jgi:phosphoribosylformylglycinamidine cyclo-ligase
MFQVFNMGIGLVAIVRAERAEAVLRFIRRRDQGAWMIGEVVRGTGKVRLV